MDEKNTDETISWLVDHKFIPSYFNQISSMLDESYQNNEASQTGTTVGGGTDLYVQNLLQLVAQQVSLIAHSPQLRFIRIKDKNCSFGGGTTVSDLAYHEELNNILPNLKEVIKLVSSSPIKKHLYYC